MNPFTVLYTMPTCACLLSLSQIYWRKKLRLCYHKLLDPKLLNTATSHCKPQISIAPLVLMFITAVTTANIDVYRHHDRFSIFNWICFYWPGIAVSNCMIHIANIINAATSKYELLNKCLNEYTHKEMTPLQKFRMGEKGGVPGKLMQRLPGSLNTVLFELFIMHDEISRIVRLVNKIAGTSMKVLN